MKRPPALAQQRFAQHKDSLELLPLSEKFEAIHKMNLWGAKTSKSGLGSEASATRAVAEALPDLCAALDIKTLIDAPCGDGRWIADVPLSINRYIGLDIVQALIEDLSQAHSGGPVREYRRIDLTHGPIPKGDLVVCRDCLVHLSHRNISRVVSQFKASNSTWLLTTHFTGRCMNEDIIDGDWRPLNLCSTPFSWPEPDLVINEECEEVNGAYRDKCMALWRICDLPNQG